MSGSTESPCSSTYGQEAETETIQNLGYFSSSPYSSWVCFFSSLVFSYIEPYFTRPAEEPVSSWWKERQSSTLEKWTTLKPFMLNQMLSSERPKQGLCQHCGQTLAVVTYRDCLPRPLYCTACDITIHESMALHNRTSMIEGFFRPLSPSTYIKEDEGGKFSYHEKGNHC